MMDDITRARGVGFKELSVLMHHAVEDFLPQIGDGGEADIVHKIVCRNNRTSLFTA